LQHGSATASSRIREVRLAARERDGNGMLPLTCASGRPHARAIGHPKQRMADEVNAFDVRGG
jgi:hypothetical protein